jgi:tellurite resistance protein TehA-like permease
MNVLWLFAHAMAVFVLTMALWGLAHIRNDPGSIPARVRHHLWIMAHILIAMAMLAQIFRPSDPEDLLVAAGLALYFLANRRTVRNKGSLQ